MNDGQNSAGVRTVLEDETYSQARSGQRRCCAAAVLLLCCSAGVQGVPVERRRRRPQGRTLALEAVEGLEALLQHPHLRLKVVLLLQPTALTALAALQSKVQLQADRQAGGRGGKSGG